MGDAEQGRRIHGAGPLEVVQKGGRTRPQALPPPAHHQGIQQGLALGPGVEEGRAFGATEPFVTVPGVEVCAQRLQIQLHLAGSVGPIHHSEDARLPGPLTDGLHRQDEGRGRGDVAQEDHPGPGRDSLPEGLHQLPWLLDGQGQRLMHQASPPLTAVEAPGPFRSPVLVVGGEHLVPRLEIQGAGHDVHPESGVGHEDQVVLRRAHVRRQGAPGLGELMGQATDQEVHWLGLQLPLPGLVALEDGPRAGAEAAVVQENHVRAQEELGREPGQGKLQRRFESVIHGGSLVDGFRIQEGGSMVAWLLEIRVLRRERWIR